MKYNATTSVVLGKGLVKEKGLSLGGEVLRVVCLSHDSLSPLKGSPLTNTDL